MSLYKKIFLVLSCCLAITTIYANDTADIDAILKHAADESPDMIKEQLTIARANADRLRGWVTYLPEVNMDYQAGGYHEIRKSIDSSDANRIGAAYSITAQHPIYHWGAIDARRDMGFAQESLSHKYGVFRYSRLIKTLRNDFNRLILDKFNLVILQKQISAKQEDVSKLRIMANQGQVSKSQLEQQELELQSIELQYTFSKNQLKRNLVLFKNSSGYLDIDLDQIPNSLPDMGIQLDKAQKIYEEFTSEKFHTSLPAEIAKKQNETVSHELTILEARQLPTFNFRGGMSQQPTEVDNKYELQTIFFVGIGGSWNLFDRAETSNNKRSLLLRKRQIKTELAIQKNELFTASQSSLEILENARQALALREKQVELNQKNYDLVRAEYERDIAPKNKLNEAELALMRAISDRMQQHARLLESYNEFLAATFQDPALAYFDPKKY